MKKTLLLLALMFVFSDIASADIAPNNKAVKPKPANEITATISIRTRSDSKEPVLSIKRESLKQLRAAIDEADNAQNYAENSEINSGFSRMQTIISGTFFSLAFIFGGVWIFRAKSKPSKIAMSLTLIAALGASASLVYANTPPPYAVNLTSRIFSKTTKTYGSASGNIKIKITDDEEQYYDVYLEIPKAADDPDLK